MFLALPLVWGLWTTPPFLPRYWFYCLQPSTNRYSQATWINSKLVGWPIINRVRRTQIAQQLENPNQVKLRWEPPFLLITHCDQFVSFAQFSVLIVRHATLSGPKSGGRELRINWIIYLSDTLKLTFSTCAIKFVTRNICSLTPLDSSYLMLVKLFISEARVPYKLPCVVSLQHLGSISHVLLFRLIP